MLTAAEDLGEFAGKNRSEQSEVGFDQCRVRLVGAGDRTQLIGLHSVSNSHLHFNQHAHIYLCFSVVYCCEFINTQFVLPVSCSHCSTNIATLAARQSIRSLISVIFSSRDVILVIFITVSLLNRYCLRCS